LPRCGEIAGEEVAEGAQVTRVLVVAQAAGGFGKPHRLRPVAGGGRGAGLGEQAGAPVLQSEQQR
jgi:hypothetical protein